MRDNGIKRKMNMWWFLAGFAAVLLSFLPYVILGTDAIVTYHDQLDGEIIAYLLRAKHLFQGSSIPEFLCGADKTALIPPAPLATVLFCILPAFAAYMVLQLVGQTAAYVGMYFLAKEMTDKPWIAALCALLYAFLPFLPVYGLTQYGLPLFACFALNLYRKKRVALSFLGIGLYAGFSSFVLCGFGCLFLWGLWLVILAIRERRFPKRYPVIGFLEMAAIYVAENASLFLQLLGIGGAGESHKAEYEIGGSNFFPLLKEYILNNGEHSTDYHKGILLLCIFTAVYLFIWRRKQAKETIGEYRKVWIVSAMLLICYLLSACWGSNGIVKFRSMAGAAGAFQLERLLWLTPPMWYFLLAWCLEILSRKGTRLRIVLGCIAAVILAGTGFSILKSSHVKPCIQKVLDPSYHMISWSDYYADGVMEQVETYITEKTGMEQSEYRVASIGIDPAAALYHGFYCVDGYSNNYSLEYKHTFRKIIEPELEKNDWLKDYFDKWGNRCYLFSSEIPGYFTIEKGTSWYNRLELNTQILREMGCRYILSAVYIVNSEELDLALMEEQPFTTDTSYYNIYLYELNPAD